MPEVLMYSKPWCPYCVLARRLLRNKGVAIRELLVHRDPALRADMERRSRRATVPQIFIGSTHIGGFQELAAMDRADRLDALLAEL